MAQPYVGEIRIFAGNFAPAGWMLCQGQLLPISENETLFQLIGTTYGGDGQSTFALPNLASRIPIHQGQGPGSANNYIIGEAAGVEQVTLTTNQIPVHNHAFLASSANGTTQSPANEVLAANPTVQMFRQSEPEGTMNPQSIQPVGGSQPHENMMPFIVINYIISLFGLFPSQT
ncbi:phage tail protein [Sphingosinicella terrae]|uniref:phage tail protein n=1 Tax=Sphingosinicella terrae TaxID=2172047 RepID=UPI000E0D33D3|nr:tail fiber protein [Sphingosinicella terrae]